MRRGTTPTHVFETDVDLTGAEVLYITYKQNGKVLFEKVLDDVDIEPDKVTTSLTQDETLEIARRGTVKVQIRVRFPDGTALASNVMSADPEEILKDGVI